MNIQEADILKTIIAEPYTNQRILSKQSGHSLGIVNKSIKTLLAENYLDPDLRPTEKALLEYEKKAPRNAIILAAGFGMRMVPINLTSPKGLLTIHGETIIERQIQQLHDAGVNDITIVVGYMKESFDYLIDKYHVKLVVNPDYASKNNLYSLALVADKISNTYIIPSDIWCEQNPFDSHELYSWYMVSDLVEDSSNVRLNRKMELVKVSENSAGNNMVGIAYLLDEDAKQLRDNIKKYTQNGGNYDDFWEIALFEGNRMIIPAKVVLSSNVVEINTYEQLRDLDNESSNLKSDALDVISYVFGVKQEDIMDISILKKGMTNRSFLFSVNREKYIMRIPGEGTDQLINRYHETEVYNTIKGQGLCDDPIYINPDNGYKITKYLDGIRVCDTENTDDLIKCMEKLRSFHNLKLIVPHTFDIFEQIEHYESLWEGHPSMYRDYKQTKENVLNLKSFIDGIEKDWCLTHIDAVADNFLFYMTPEGEKLQLTDWEYSGMQDPHVDIAMFAIYAMYDKTQIDKLIDIYFNNNCCIKIRTKIYAYIAMCGLLWSNWCEFKAKLGVEFGEYSLYQYRYAKDYYHYAVESMEGLSEDE